MYTSLFTSALLLCSLSAAVPQEAVRRKFNGPSDPARFRFFRTPTPGSGICDMDTDPDGIKLWYQDLIANKIGVFDPRTEKFEEYVIPYSRGPSKTPPFLGNVTALQCVVRTGKDGMIYGGAGTRNEIVQVNPRTRELKIFSPAHQNPVGNLENFNDAWAADQGLYFSQVTGNVVTLFDYKTHRFTNFHCPTKASGPLGMRTDKHNNLWFTNFFAQKISRLDNNTGHIEEFNVPLPAGLFPEVLRASSENQRYLWANAFGAGGFIRIDVAKRELKTFTNPTPRGPLSEPFENDNDYCGRIWYSSVTQNILVYYTPKTGKWTNVKVPKRLPTPAGDGFVAMHRGPLHSMWFTEATTNSIGQYMLEPDCRGEPH